MPNPDDEVGIVDIQTLAGHFKTILSEEMRPAQEAARVVSWDDAFSAFQQALDKGSGNTCTVLFSSPRDDLVVKAIQSVVACVPDLVRERQAALQEKDIETLVALMMPKRPTMNAEAALQLDNARARARFLKETACFTSKEVQEIAGHTAGNVSITASRWKRDGKVFAITHGGADLYPAFQFRDDQPHPSVAKVLAALPQQKSRWQVAFWFTSSNSWLRGATPAERLDDEAAVVMAAQREAEDPMG